MDRLELRAAQYGGPGVMALLLFAATPEFDWTWLGLGVAGVLVGLLHLDYRRQLAREREKLMSRWKKL